MSDDVMSVMTPYPDVAQLAQGYMQRADGERLWVPLSAPSEPGAAVRFVIHLADGTVGFAGAGRCVQVADQGEAVDPAIRYEALLDSLAFDERSQPVYDYIVAVRAAALEDATGEDVADDLDGDGVVDEADAAYAEADAPAEAAANAQADWADDADASADEESSFVDEGETDLGGDLDAASAAFEPDEDGYAADAAAWSDEQEAGDGPELQTLEAVADEPAEAQASGFVDEATPASGHEAYADGGAAYDGGHDSYQPLVSGGLELGADDKAAATGEESQPPVQQAFEATDAGYDAHEQASAAEAEYAADVAHGTPEAAPAHAADAGPTYAETYAAEQTYAEPEPQPDAYPDAYAAEPPAASDATSAEAPIATGILTRPGIATHWRPEPPQPPTPAASTGLFLYDTRGLPQPTELPRPQLAPEQIVTRAIHPRDFPNGSTAPEAFAAAVGGAPEAEVSFEGHAADGSEGAVDELELTDAESSLSLEPDLSDDIEDVSYEGADYEVEEPIVKAAD